jgi:hypothetical protein
MLILHDVPWGKPNYRRNRKNKKMEEDGRRNKEPLKVGEKHEGQEK